MLGGKDVGGYERVWKWSKLMLTLLSQVLCSLYVSLDDRLRVAICLQSIMLTLVFAQGAVTVRSRSLALAPALAVS